MTRSDMFRECLRAVADATTDEDIARQLLQFARTYDCDDQLGSLWCDNEGAYKGRDCESLGYCCSDEEHVACILRYLQGEYVPKI